MPDRNTDVILVDDPRPKVRRLTLNRPEKRNAMNNVLRSRLFEELRAADSDWGVRVVIIRGGGPCFSSGYDLAQNMTADMPHHDAIQDGFWSRHVVRGWFEMWDYATPVVAQVHGHCLAGGSELATACDLVYVAEDAKIGYPPVRLMSPPDMTWQPWLMGMRRAMEALLTGDSMSGTEAVQAGFANRAWPEDRLEGEVLDMAERVAKIPNDLLALNKRAVHRAMEIMGMRDAMRATADIQALGFHQQSSKDYMQKMMTEGVSKALDERDGQFGDGRTG